MPTMTANLAYLTSDLPGIGGVIKQRPEDFFVEEQPIYPPCGRGEHLYLLIEKRNCTTSDVVHRLARVFRVDPGDVGYAGLKDKNAVTRQHLSITLPDQANDSTLLPRVESDRVKVLGVWRHENKLRRGHLVGNRFVIHIRGVDPSAAVPAKRILDRLTVTGAPNFIGDQRFGYRQQNHELGRLMLLGQWKPMLDLMLGGPLDTDFESTRLGREAYDRGDLESAVRAWPKHLRHDRQALLAILKGRSHQRAVMAIDRGQRDFLVSSVQSVIFNRLLHRRMTEGLFDRLVEGDLAWKHNSRAVFAVDQATAELENSPEGRVKSLAVSPSGPMWGGQMPRATGEVARREHDALKEFGLEETDLQGGPQGKAEGNRRPFREAIRGPEVAGGADEHGPYVRVSFAMSRGCFATVVLREIMKNEPVASGAQSWMLEPSVYS
jgi:tRNA pseudouridine13 synthase